MVIVIVVGYGYNSGYSVVMQAEGVGIKKMTPVSCLTNTQSCYSLKEATEEDETCWS